MEAKTFTAEEMGKICDGVKETLSKVSDDLLSWGSTEAPTPTPEVIVAQHQDDEKPEDSGEGKEELTYTSGDEGLDAVPEEDEDLLGEEDEYHDDDLSDVSGSGIGISQVSFILDDTSLDGERLDSIVDDQTSPSCAPQGDRDSASSSYSGRGKGAEEMASSWAPKEDAESCSFSFRKSDRNEKRSLCPDSVSVRSPGHGMMMSDSGRSAGMLRDVMKMKQGYGQEDQQMTLGESQKRRDKKANQPGHNTPDIGTVGDTLRKIAVHSPLWPQIAKDIMTDWATEIREVEKAEERGLGFQKPYRGLAGHIQAGLSIMVLSHAAGEGKSVLSEAVLDQQESILTQLKEIKQENKSLRNDIKALTSQITALSAGMTRYLSAERAEKIATARPIQSPTKPVRDPKIPKGPHAEALLEKKKDLDGTPASNFGGRGENMGYVRAKAIRELLVMKMSQGEKQELAGLIKEAKNAETVENLLDSHRKS